MVLARLDEGKAMGSTVLIVDDDAMLVRTIHDLLELDGFHAVGTSDAPSLVPLVATVAPDVILIDLMLAATSGMELAAELREGALASIPRIAMSSSPFMLEIAEESKLFDAVIAKPIDFEGLVDLITYHTGDESDGARE